MAEHPLLGGSQFNQPQPYGRRSTDRPIHPVEKAQARHQRFSELKGVAKGTQPEHAMEHMEPAVTGIEPLQNPLGVVHP